MRGIRGILGGVLLAALFAGCGGGSSMPTAPSNPSTGNGGGGGAGGVSDGPPSASLSVTVGNIFFRSDRNNTVNPAVDTVLAGGTVTWTWVNTGGVPHTVQSIGTPSFTSSGLIASSGSTYQLTFSTPGTYQYNCAVHGNLMTGTVVVIAQ
jgi:plastocyanin